MFLKPTKLKVFLSLLLSTLAYVLHALFDIQIICASLPCPVYEPPLWTKVITFGEQPFLIIFIIYYLLISILFTFRSRLSKKT